MLEKKEKWINKGYDTDSLLHNITSHTQCLYKISKSYVKLLFEISLMKYSIGEKEKWTNKGNDKNKDADSFLHNTSGHTQFKILGAVAPEKYLTQIFLCIKLE